MDTAQAGARFSRDFADLNAAEVALAISKATYGQVIGEASGRLAAVTPVDRLSPATMPTSIKTAISSTRLRDGYDVDVEQTTITVVEGSLLLTVAVQASASRSKQSDSTLGTHGTDQASIQDGRGA